MSKSFASKILDGSGRPRRAQRTDSRDFIRNDLCFLGLDCGRTNSPDGLLTSTGFQVPVRTGAVPGGTHSCHTRHPGLTSGAIEWRRFATLCGLFPVTLPAEPLGGVLSGVRPFPFAEFHKVSVMDSTECRLTEFLLLGRSTNSWRGWAPVPAGDGIH